MGDEWSVNPATIWVSRRAATIADGMVRSLESSCNNGLTLSDIYRRLGASRVSCRSVLLCDLPPLTLQYIVGNPSCARQGAILWEASVAQLAKSCPHHRHATSQTNFLVQSKIGYRNSRLPVPRTHIDVYLTLNTITEI